MEVKKYYCDREGCNKERVGHFKVFSHCESDPSGNGSVSWYLYFDLCKECVEKFFNGIMEFQAHLKPEVLGERLRAFGVKYEIR